ILLSDGQANVGMVDLASLGTVAQAAAEQGIHVTTVGLGLDYNEDLMEALAERGRGQYYYVKDAASLERVFAGELRALEATVATQLELRIEPAAPGVEILDVPGYPLRRVGAAALVPLADLAGGETRKIVVKLRAPVHTLGAQPIVRATLAFAEARSGAARHATAE